ncbi:VENN motif pre-toxin domain-containing protein [Moraxella cuniculi]|nr:VENN motif pre-toxin domain-containing protein [Moraxella cuniculi]
MTNRYPAVMIDGKTVYILSDQDKQKIINTAKLLSASAALLYEFDVNTASASAEEAVRWNQLGRRTLTRNRIQQQRRDIIELEIQAIRRIYPEFQGIPSFRPAGQQISEAEVLEYQAFARFVRASNQTYTNPYEQFRRVYYGGYSANNPIMPNGRYSSITFGNNPNQSYHTWRHLQNLRISRLEAEPIIRNDLHQRNLNSIPIGQTQGFTIMIGQQRVTYFVYRINATSFNIGRIHADR